MRSYTSIDILTRERQF